MAVGRAGSTATVTVTDTGSGILPEDLPRVFDGSFRGSPREDRSGAGLVLAIAKRIIELHGGRIFVESAPGAGARFVFRLSIYDGGSFQPPGGATGGELNPLVLNLHRNPVVARQRRQFALATAWQADELGRPSAQATTPGVTLGLDKTRLFGVREFAKSTKSLSVILAARAKLAATPLDVSTTVARVGGILG